jgi:hypothetical protein
MLKWILKGGYEDVNWLSSCVTWVKKQEKNVHEEDYKFLVYLTTLSVAQNI